MAHTRYDFGNHDGTMHARRSLAAGDNPGDIVGIALRRMLFVLLREVSRILSAVPAPPSGFFRTHVEIYISRPEIPEIAVDGESSLLYF
jgi:hypothetical protein